MEEITIFYEKDFITRSINREGIGEVITDAEGGGFSPIDLLAVSLGSCFLTILGMAAKRLSADITGSKVRIYKEMSQTLPRRVSLIQVHFSCPMRFSIEMEEKLEQAAKKCPIHYTLHPEVKQEFFFTWGDA